MFEISPEEWAAIGLSLRVSFWSALGSLPPGVFVAWLLARRRFLGHGLLNGLVHLPLVLPPVVVGYLLLLLLGRNGAIGAWLHDGFGVTLAFSWQGAAVAAAVMGFPLMVRAVRLSFEAVDQGLERAARTLGAGPVDAFATITMPLIAPGLLTGFVLSFARAFGEFGATIVFVSSIPGETRTLPLAIYNLTQTPYGEAAAMRLVSISIVIALAALFASEILARRVRERLGASG